MQNLNEIITCKVCNKYLLNPVFLPCCKNVCQNHIIKQITESNQQFYKCGCCNQNHQVPQDGFNLNETLIDVINLNLHLDEKTRSAKMLLNDLDQVNNDIELINKDPENFIYSYFSNEKNKIDLKRDTLISRINDISDEMINKIKKMETDSKLN